MASRRRAFCTRGLSLISAISPSWSGSAFSGNFTPTSGAGGFRTTSRVGRCLVCPGLSNAEGSSVGGTDRMPPPMPPIIPPPMPPIIPPPPIPIPPIIPIIRLRLSQLSGSPQKYMIIRDSVINPMIAGMVPDIRPMPPMPPIMPPRPPIPPPMPPIPPPMPPMPPPMPPIPPPMPPMPPNCPVAPWAIRPGGRTTRNDRRVRFVTEIVIRPSPRPSACTETRPSRFASRRFISGIFSAGTVSAPGRAAADLSAGGREVRSTSSAEARDNGVVSKTNAPTPPIMNEIRLRICVHLSSVRVLVRGNGRNWRDHR